jgi:hypothetical protein
MSSASHLFQVAFSYGMTQLKPANIVAMDLWRSFMGQTLATYSSGERYAAIPIVSMRQRVAFEGRRPPEEGNGHISAIPTITARLIRLWRDQPGHGPVSTVT